MVFDRQLPKQGSADGDGMSGIDAHFCSIASRRRDL
jgi:hypothetical protein